MLKKIVFLLFLSFFLYHCKKSSQQEKIEVKKPEMSIANQHKKYNELDKFSSEKIANWKEYTALKEFLNRFESISPNNALNNALELKDLTKQLKDSIRIEELKNRAFKARVNVLENEALRLADMTYIPTIGPKEVNNQVDKIFLIFGSLNTKITSFYKQEQLNKDIDLKDFLSLDSTESRRPAKKPVIENEYDD